MKKPTNKTNDIRDFILTNIERNPRSITGVTSRRFSISKQAVRNHIKFLVNEGKVKPYGTTKDRVYKLSLLDSLDIKLPIHKDIAEDRIWRNDIQPKLADINKNILDICEYGFTEMINNVVDHSEGNELAIEYRRTAAYIEMRISDDGIGIFEKISKTFNLEDKIQAILELAKGKLTTDPKKHSGEGIFFTSRSFDNFMIISSNLTFAHVQSNDDWLLETKEDVYQGTIIDLRISPNSNRILKDVFDMYSDSEDYGFSKTHIPVTLARYGNDNLVSRSQAKRLLTRFERFKEIILDFSSIDYIGQAFADEIFRVFQSSHPEIHITFINASSEVKKMIYRAMKLEEEMN